MPGALRSKPRLAGALTKAPACRGLFFAAADHIIEPVHHSETP